MKQIVYFLNKKISGTKKCLSALVSVPGIGFSFAQFLMHSLNISPKEFFGNLDVEQIKKIESKISDSSIPKYFLNTSDKHLLFDERGTNIQQNIDKMKKINSYKGVFHAKGAKVRGQNSKNNGRKNAIVGVVKKKSGPNKKK